MQALEPQAREPIRIFRGDFYGLVSDGNVVDVHGGLKETDEQDRAFADFGAKGNVFFSFLIPVKRRFFDEEIFRAVPAGNFDAVLIQASVSKSMTQPPLPIKQKQVQKGRVMGYGTEGLSERAWIPYSGQVCQASRMFASETVGHLSAGAA
jgi:hypothetical protein